MPLKVSEPIEMEVGRRLDAESQRRVDEQSEPKAQQKLKQLEFVARAELAHTDIEY